MHSYKLFESKHIILTVFSWRIIRTHASIVGIIQYAHDYTTSTHYFKVIFLFVDVISTSDNIKINKSTIGDKIFNKKIRISSMIGQDHRNL